MTVNHLKRYIQCMFLLLVTSSVLAQNLEFGSPFTITDGFLIPAGLGIDNASNRVFVSDTGNHRVKYANIADLSGTPAWSEFGYYVDRLLPEALTLPQGVAADSAGNVYVIDTFGNEVQLYRWDGNTYTYDPAFAQTTRNTVNGIDIAFPRDISVGSDNKVYLLDSGNHRILVADGPSDDSWSVWKENILWSNPYGLDVSANGTIYLADTDNHQILRIPSTGSEQAFGRYGTGNGEFRNPRDVAISNDGKIFVADTYNNRIVILNSDGSFYRNLGSAPLFGKLEKIEVDDRNRVFVIDSDNDRLVAYLGTGEEPPFDAYIRDFIGDSGEEPSQGVYVLSSPDILVRHSPDVDLAQAATVGLGGYAFQQPLYEKNNYVYLAVRNRGTQGISGVTAKLYWADPGGTMEFPQDWQTDGIYGSYVNDTINTSGNSIFIPFIEPRHTDGSVEVDGLTVVGPIIWRPIAPESVIARDGNFCLLVRLVHLDDPSEGASGLEQVRLNNNIALRRAEVTRGPFPVGVQDTLVVRVNFPDIVGEADLSTVTTRITELSQWVNEVSYGTATLIPLFRGPLTLDNNKDYYSRPDQNLLIEMTTEVLNKLLSADMNVLNGPTADPKDDIDRIIVVLNDPDFRSDWATTGHWPYEIGGQTWYLSVSVQGPHNNTSQYAHGFSHQLGLKDLYIHENVDFPLEHVADRWDNMAKPFEGAHPLTWSKELATWVTSSGGKVFYIPRPPKGTPPRIGEPAIHVNYQSILESDQYGAVAISLTEGVTTFEEERHFYWVEARSPDLGNTDSVVPADGVLVYYANKLIPQGQAPVIIRDYNTGTAELDDAVVPVGGSINPGNGITIGVDSKVPNNGGYMVRIDYDPPPTDYNVYIRIGDPGWTSPDIWVDNQRDGGGYHSYDAIQHASSGPVEEQPIGGEENRIYARVHNDGPAPAFEVEVQFHLIQPYTVDGSFELYKIVFIDEIPPGEYRDVFVVWTPMAEGDPHNCINVQLRRLVSDTNEADNSASENVSVIPSSQASPYDPAIFNFYVRNSDPGQKLVYYQVHGVPPNWSKTLSARKRLLAPGQSMMELLTVQPPDDEPVCTNHEFTVTAWTPRGDTLIPLGGTTVDVRLRNRTELTLDTEVTDCKQLKRQKMHSSSRCAAGVIASGDVNIAFTDPGARVPIGPVTAPKQCAIIKSNGCTDPPRKNETMWVSYKDPAGNPVYREVVTDEFGCFEDSIVVVEGGEWQAAGYYPGDKCSGPAEVKVGFDVPLPEAEHPGDDIPNAENHLCVFVFSKDLKGQIVSSEDEKVLGRKCEIKSLEQVLKIEFFPHEGGDNEKGIIEISNLRHLLRQSKKKDPSGLNRGRFVLKSNKRTVVGRVSGLTHIGTHHKPLPTPTEPTTVPEHWELALDGVVVEGSDIGFRFRSSVVLDLDKNSKKLPSFVGALEGILEKDCELIKDKIKKRVTLAMKEIKGPEMGPCKEGFPCIFRISKYGKGEMFLQQIGHNICGDKKLVGYNKSCKDKGNQKSNKCQTYKTWNLLKVEFEGIKEEEESEPVLPNGILTVEDFHEVLNQSGKGRGEHGGQFEYVSRSGIVVHGEMTGVSQSGSHREPTAWNLEKSYEFGHLEGRLVGTILNGANKGVQVETRYVIEIDEKGDNEYKKRIKKQPNAWRHKQILMTLDGWGIDGCFENPKKEGKLTIIRTDIDKKDR